MNKIVIVLSIFLMLGCGSENFFKQAHTQFDDQHFKTAIALIELHKIRYDHYPASLDCLTFIGAWDHIIFSQVEYERLENGYRLDIGAGMIKVIPDSLQYPKEFWNGLGLKQSNLLK